MSASDKEGKTQYFVSGIHLPEEGETIDVCLSVFCLLKKMFLNAYTEKSLSHPVEPPLAYCDRNGRSFHLKHPASTSITNLCSQHNYCRKKEILLLTKTYIFLLTCFKHPLSYEL